MHTEPYGMLWFFCVCVFFIFYSLFKLQQHCTSLTQKLEGYFSQCYSEHTSAVAMKTVWDLKAHRGKIWCLYTMCPGCGMCPGVYGLCVTGSDIICTFCNYSIYLFISVNLFYYVFDCNVVCHKQVSVRPRRYSLTTYC